MEVRKREHVALKPYVPVSVQLIIGMVLLMLTLLWHNRYRAYKPVTDSVYSQSDL